MKLPGSNFVSPIGLGLIAVLILVAAYFGFGTLETFLILALLVCLAAYLWGRFALSRIELDCAEEDCCAFPGQIMEAEACFRNRKLLPLIWLDLSFPLEGKTCLATPEDELSTAEMEAGTKPDELRSAFVWVMPHQTIRWKQRARAVHRGVCRVEKLRLYSGDGFGLSTRHTEAALPRAFRFVVYPKLIEVDPSLILHNMSEMESAKNGFYTDRTLLETIRDYREGDNFKSINWRLLAKRDELQVNVYEKLNMHRVCFIPDLMSYVQVVENNDNTERQFVRILDSEGLERMFSLMASLIVRLHERGVLCSVVVPQIGEEPERLIIPETAEGQVMELLGALAEIDYVNQNAGFPMEAVERERHKLGQIYIFSDSTKTANFVRAAEELSAIRIVRKDTGETEERNIFTETDLLLI